MNRNQPTNPTRWHMSPTNKSMKSNFSYQSYDNLDPATINALVGSTPYPPPIFNNGSRSSLYKSIPVTPAFAPTPNLHPAAFQYQQTYQQTYQQNQTPTSKSFGFVSGGVQYQSGIERAILESTDPIDIEPTGEEIEVNGERGLWANKSEVALWRASHMPINEYAINTDLNPELVTKKPNRSVEYIQEFAIRYLRPPTPPSPGEIIIQQMANVPTPPAPPLIIRQQPPRPSTPEPIVSFI